ncbi:MAG: histidine kinase dimerization/phospho-acceptor domain-containing protein, partial [Eubacterium sp.]|nr:histidine kinase dimerization/phospho-acceptor domain-containing protein [Eubacterium sp.]
MEWTVDNWIQNVSLGASVLIAVVLLLFLVGKKIAYLKKIILGVKALRTHRMDYKIPLEGNNEFTELAETINYLSKTELELKEKEEQLQNEKENFIRSLSHDIRTPLTSILSYSEYMNSKDTVTSDEVKEYVSLMQKKAQQIKTLTDQLL